MHNCYVKCRAGALKFRLLFLDIRTRRGGARMNIAPRTTTKEEEEGIRRTLEECLTTGDLLETMAPWGRITTGPFMQTNPRP